MLVAWRPEHWFNFAWGIDTYDNTTNTFTFGEGGYQGGQSLKDPAVAGEYYISNVFEELDAPNEYWYDKGTKRLYVHPLLRQHLALQRQAGLLRSCAFTDV